MAFTIFVDEIASWSSDSWDQARALAEPYIGLGRVLSIRRFSDDTPPRTWIYDFNDYDWVEQASPSPAHFDFMLPR